MSETGDEKKGPSKKELKKMAKKAEKSAMKQQAKGGDTDAKATDKAMKGNSNSSSNNKSVLSGPTDPAKQSKLPSPPEFYGLLNGDDSSSTLKVAVASTSWNVSLKSKSLSNRSDCAFLTMPALVIPDNTDGLVFGGNAILRVMSMMRKKDDPSMKVMPLDPAIDEWLEWEHEILRHSVANFSTSKKPKDLDNALQELDTALSSGDGLHLVGKEVTAADLSIICTLYKDLNTDICVTLPSSVEKYMKYQTSKSSFKDALNLMPTLLPPIMPKLNPSDPSLDHALEATFCEAVSKAFPPLDVGEVLTVCKTQKCNSVKHGDYQCIAAMPLFGQIKANPTKFASCAANIRSPKDVAQRIIDVIPKDHPVVDASTLTLQGPGFIMCRLSSTYLQHWMNQLIKEGKAIKPLKLNPATCVVDFSSPNIAKEMHVGHLRSTIIGESVCRVLEYAGNQVVRMNHVGDWGTQFGMLIQYLKEEYPSFADNPPNITDLTQFYKSAKQRFDENEAFKKQSQLNVPLLQSHDPGCVAIWKLLCDISRKEFQKVYDRLDCHLDEYGESFYNSRIPGAIEEFEKAIPGAIEEFEKAGLVKVQEGGAKCVFIDGIAVPLMLQKSDGGYGYDSTDIAALKYRIQEVGAKRIIVITDFSQEGHFELCYKAAKLIGWTQPNNVQLEHIGFGIVQGEDGKRFKTRSGDTVRLVDLLDEAVNRMETSLKDRMAEKKANISEDEVHKTACTLGYGAVKYFDLRRNPTTNYKFSYDQMLDTKGNTAIYLLYAYARLQSIMAKAKAEHSVDVVELAANKEESIKIEHASERSLSFALQQFSDMINMTLGDLFPYHICDFLYSASVSVGDFVTQCKVLGSPEMKSRLLLCHATSIVLRQCFDLLGIGYVDSI